MTEPGRATQKQRGKPSYGRGGRGRGYNGPRQQSQGRGGGRGRGNGSLKADMELMKKCNYDFKAFAEAKEAQKAKQLLTLGSNNLLIPPEGFTPNHRQLPPVKEDVGGEMEAEASDEMPVKGEGATEEQPKPNPPQTQPQPPEQVQMGTQSKQTPSKARDEKDLNGFGQAWEETTQPSADVRCAFNLIADKLHKGKTITEADVKVKYSSPSDGNDGVSLAVVVAILVAYHRAEAKNIPLDSDKLFEYLKWYSVLKLTRMINEHKFSDELVEKIMSHEQGHTEFNPSKVTVANLRSLHGVAAATKLQENRENPTEIQMIVAIRNVVARLYPADADDIMREVKRSPKWEMASLTFGEGTLGPWMERHCPPSIKVSMPKRFDLSYFNGISEEATVHITDGAYKIEEEEEEVDDSEEDEDLKLEAKAPIRDWKPLKDMKIDEALFHEMSNEEKKDQLTRSLPSYIISIAPQYLSASIKLNEMSPKEVIELLDPFKLAKFLKKHGDQSMPQSPAQSQPEEEKTNQRSSKFSQSDMKYGKDNHGSNEIFIYKVQIRSGQRHGEDSGTAQEKFQKLIGFIHAMLTSLNHTCEFIQWKSSSECPPINRSDDLPSGSDLDPYIGQLSHAGNSTNKFRNFFYKIKTSYPFLGKLEHQETIVNGKYAKPFQLFLQSSKIIMAIYQATVVGTRQRTLIRGLTERSNPEDVKEELVRRAEAKGHEVDTSLFQLNWASCSTPSRSSSQLTTAGLCIFCSIEDDEVIDEWFGHLPRATVLEYPITFAADFVDAVYTKDTRATMQQYYRQLTYQDEFIKGSVYLTVSGVPSNFSPYGTSSANSENIQLSSQAESKVEKASLSISQLMILHQFPLLEDTISSPIRAVHRDPSKNKWYIEATESQAEMLAFLSGDVISTLSDLVQAQLSSTKEGMVSRKAARIEALKKIKMTKEKNLTTQSSSIQGTESTVSQSTASGTSSTIMTPPKPPKPPSEPTKIPPTPAKDPNAELIQESLINTIQSLSQVSSQLKTQADQMEEMKKEIVDLRALISESKRPEVIDTSGFASQMSDLTESSNQIRTEILAFHPILRDIKGIMGTPVKGAWGKDVSPIDKIYTQVNSIAETIVKASENLTELTKIQKFQLDQSTVMAQEIEQVQRESVIGLGILENLEEASKTRSQDESKHSIALGAMQDAIRITLQPIMKQMETTPKAIKAAIEAQMNSSILRCIVEQGPLRTLLYDSMSTSDRAPSPNFFKGHNHRELPALTSLDWPEITRLLHKSPDFMAAFETPANGMCAKCDEVAIPGQMADCSVCNRTYHKLCHTPEFFLRRGGVDLKFCRFCRDAIHLERLIEEMMKCEKCIEYVKKTKKVLQERAVDYDTAQRVEQEAKIRDAVKGNDMWNDIHRELENNMMFLMQRYLPEDDPEQSAPEDVRPPQTENADQPQPSNPPSYAIPNDHQEWPPPNDTCSSDNARPICFKTESGKVLEIDLNSGLSTLQKKWIKTLLPNEFADPPDPPSAPPTPKLQPKPSSIHRQEVEEPKSPEGPTHQSAEPVEAPFTPETGNSSPIMPTDSPTVIADLAQESDLVESSSASNADSEEDDSVVQKEDRKSKRTLRPAPSREYNLRRRRKAEEADEASIQSEADEVGAVGHRDSMHSTLGSEEEEGNEIL